MLRSCGTDKSVVGGAPGNAFLRQSREQYRRRAGTEEPGMREIRSQQTARRSAGRAGVRAPTPSHLPAVLWIRVWAVANIAAHNRFSSRSASEARARPRRSALVRCRDDEPAASPGSSPLA